MTKHENLSNMKRKKKYEMKKLSICNGIERRNERKYQKQEEETNSI